VVLLDLLGPRVVRAQALPEGDRGQAADRELLRAIEELAPCDVAVLVLVEEVQQLLGIIGRLLPLHDGPLSLPPVQRCRSANAKSAFPAAMVTYCRPLT